MNNQMNVVSKVVLSGLLSLAILPTAQAQQYYDSRDRYNDRRDEVIIFSDCEFRGASRRVSVGEFRNLGQLDFNNDSMSSIQVPEGLEVTLYKDDRFRGDYTRVDRDVVCFDKTWNDEVSSLRVSEVNRGRSDRRDRNDNNYGLNRDQRGSDYRNNSRLGSDINRGGANTQNVSKVFFSNRELKRTTRGRWQLDSPRNGVTRFDEISSDRDSIFLQSRYSGEKVRIDLYQNDVTITDRRGRSNSYRIKDTRVAQNRAVVNSQPNRSVATNQPNRVINGQCFSYKAYARGGSGGLRFHGHDGFVQLSSNAKTGKICHSGALTMELSKKQPSTNVIVEIQGKRFGFAANEKEDVLLNTWYRKKVKLRVN